MGARATFSILIVGLVVAGAGCTPNPPVIPAGPQSTKTGYSYTYKLNGRVPEGEVEAAGEIPKAGNATFRASPPAHEESGAKEAKPE